MVGDVIAVALGLFRIRPLGVALYMFAGKAMRYILITLYTLYLQQGW